MGGAYSMYMSGTNTCSISARKQERKIELTGKTVLKFILKIGDDSAQGISSIAVELSAS
jgi:hypothetical protein